VLATIPPPPFSELSIGPLHVRMYGLLIATGVLVAVWWARHRLAKRGGDPDFITDLALWAVPAGLIGARIYHLITDYDRTYCGLPGCPKSLWPDGFKIWDGGLGIPGGIAAGFAVGLWYCWHRKVDIKLMMDIVAPVMPIAQAIGRWGNYFNQELFGGKTTLPWALRVDSSIIGEYNLEHHTAYALTTTFHPTFLYESLWNIGVVLMLLLMERMDTLKKGKLFPAYITLYFTGRMWVEELRIDSAARVDGVRWNFILSLIMIVVGLIWFFWGGPTRAPGEPYSTVPFERGGSEGVEDGVGEPGPDVERPGAEVADAEPDEAQAGVGVDPQEGA
jgi:prolipoprotein diacylglyceryl transferase